ncbi:MAG: LapA family protein [candidate division NC10 bacterium]|nr:LapA family protein [candidate division NC10 bacterium]
MFLPVVALTPFPFSDSMTPLLRILLRVTTGRESLCMTQLYLMLALLLTTLVAIFALQNADEVTVRFLVWTFQTSVVIVILTSAGMGALLAALLSLPQTLRARRRMKESEEKLERLSRQLGGSQMWEAVNEEE